MVVPTLSYGTKDNKLMFNELLTNLISYIGEVSGDNQLLAAALMGSISIFISGLVGFVCRRLYVMYVVPWITLVVGITGKHYVIRRKVEPVRLFVVVFAGHPITITALLE